MNNNKLRLKIPKLSLCSDTMTNAVPSSEKEPLISDPHAVNSLPEKFFHIDKVYEGDHFLVIPHMYPLQNGVRKSLKVVARNRNEIAWRAIELIRDQIAAEDRRSYLLNPGGGNCLRYEYHISELRALVGSGVSAVTNAPTLEELEQMYTEVEGALAAISPEDERSLRQKLLSIKLETLEQRRAAEEAPNTTEEPPLLSPGARAAA